MKTEKNLQLGQPSWRIANRNVEAYVSELGGQLGPVTFKVGGRKIQPFAIAPWAEENLASDTPPIIKVLRGDFFCLPFGGNATPYKEERHPVHGETANKKWACNGIGEESLHLKLATRLRPGQVDKHITLREGHSAVYVRHVISGMSGPMSFGHHAMLRFPDRPGSGRISTSRFVYGQVAPLPLEKPEERGYSRLKPGAEFRSLEKVRTQDGEYVDLSQYPARRGFEDLVMMVNDARKPLAWTAVTFPEEGYAWFALKNPRVLRETIFWISNGGRHYPPWNGRHVNVLGLEEVTSYFHYGLAESVAKNPISSRGHATSQILNPAQNLNINYIMAVASIPKGFDQVASIAPTSDGSAVCLESRSGGKVELPMDVRFLELDR